MRRKSGDRFVLRGRRLALRSAACTRVAFWRGTLEQAVHSRGGPPAGVGADGMPGDHYQVVHRKPVRHVRAAAAAAAEPAGCCSRRCSASLATSGTGARTIGSLARLSWAG